MCASCMKERNLGLSSNKGHNSCFIHLYITVFSVFLWVITYLGIWKSWLFPFEGSKLFVVSFIQHSTRFQRGGKVSLRSKPCDTKSCFYLSYFKILLSVVLYTSIKLWQQMIFLKTCFKGHLFPSCEERIIYFLLASDSHILGS